MARRGRRARPAEQQADGRRAAGAGDGQGEEALPQVRRPVRARARLARRDRLGALRQGLEHRGQLRPRHRPDHDPAGRGALPRRARPGRRASRGVATVVRARVGPGRLAGRRDRRARARPARGPRGGVRPGRGAGLRRPRSSRPRRPSGRSPTSSRPSSRTSSGRCPSTASCCSSTESPRRDERRPTGDGRAVAVTRRRRPRGARR